MSRSWIYTGALALASAATSAPALADIGPKPTISFVDFAFDRPGVGIKSGVLLECEDAKCADPKPLLRVGPQGFGCGTTSCSGRAYGFAPYLRLEIVLSDGRDLRSAVFAKTDFDARYRVAVEGSVLKVTPTK